MARRNEPEVTPAVERQDEDGAVELGPDGQPLEPTPGSDASDVDGPDEGDDEDKPTEPPFMSEGVRQDLLQSGRAVDPMTGGLFERDPDSGLITFTDKRTGDTIDFEL